VTCGPGSTSTSTGGTGTASPCGQQQPSTHVTNAAETSLNTLVRTSYPTGRAATLPSAPDPGPGRIPTVMQPGQTLYIAAPEAGAEVCVAFGDPSNGWCVPVSDTATGELEVAIPPGFCDGVDIGQVCHDIICYESSTVDGVTYTQSSVQPMLAACGGCDSPSCAQLIESGICECASDADCSAGQTCDGGVCVIEGVLRFSARWDTQLDVDLHVIDPDGSELYFGTDSVPSGGVLDNDDTSGGPGTIENAAWATTAPAGVYTYWVENFSGGDAGSITLSVFENGIQQNTQSITIGTLAGDISSQFTYSYSP
jgi:hypothetical protein